MYASVEVIINDDALPSVIACEWEDRELAVSSTATKYCQYIKDRTPTTLKRVVEFVTKTGKIGYGNVSFHVVKV